jgi:hypothetical protein
MASFFAILLTAAGAALFAVGLWSVALTGQNKILEAIGSRSAPAVPDETDRAMSPQTSPAPAESEDTGFDDRYLELSALFGAIERHPAVRLGDIVERISEAAGPRAPTDYQAGFSTVLHLTRRLNAIRALTGQPGDSTAEARSLLEECDRVWNAVSPRAFLVALDVARQNNCREGGEIENLLAIEPIHVVEGMGIADQSAFDIEDSIGEGRLRFVDRVTANGYRLKSTGEVLRKPRIFVRRSNGEAPPRAGG